MNSVCSACKHLHRPVKFDNDPTCNAFPEGIPRPILISGGHHEPFPGDRGIMFEELSDDEKVQVAIGTFRSRRT